MGNKIIQGQTASITIRLGERLVGDLYVGIYGRYGERVGVCTTADGTLQGDGLVYDLLLSPAFTATMETGLYYLEMKIKRGEGYVAIAGERVAFTVVSSNIGKEK